MATTLLRAATWRAARSALTADLLDPFSGLPRPAVEVVASLVAHVAPALDATGDRAHVDRALSRLLARGPGATRQHELLARSADLHRLVLDAADHTLR